MAVLRFARAIRAALTMLAATAMTVAVATGCEDGADNVDAVASAGWSSYGGNAANSNYAYPTVPANLALRWTRPTGGPISTPTVISGKGNVAVNSATPSGCGVFVFDAHFGRKDFCRRFADGSEFNAPLVDQFDNYYIGEPGKFYSINAGGGNRWTFPTTGMALSATFAAPTVVFVATTQGQLLLLRAQTGNLVAAPVALRTDATPDDPTAGLADCVAAGPHCAIASPPAVNVSAQRAYLNFWPQGAIASQVRAFDYSEVNGTRVIREAWKADVPGGVIGPPTLSADGKTVYVFSRLGQLYAIDTDTAKPRWNVNLGGYGFATMSVSPDGVILPALILGGPAIALRDLGTRVATLWRRDDVQTAGLATLTSSGTAWIPTRDPNTSALSLTEVSATTGKTTRTLSVPDSTGFLTGIAVSAGGDLVTSVNNGAVYYFAKPSSSTP